MHRSNTSRSVIVGAGIVFCLVSVAVGIAQSGEVVFGSICRQRVWGYVAVDGNARWYIGDVNSGSLNLLETAIAREAMAHIVADVDFWDDAGNIPSRWKIHGDCFWSTKIGELGTSHATHDVLRVAFSKLEATDSLPGHGPIQTAQASRLPGEVDRAEMLPHRTVDLEPLGGCYPDARGRVAYDGSDIVPIGPNKIILVVVGDGKAEVWRWNGDRPPRRPFKGVPGSFWEKLYQEEGRWSHKETFVVPFSGPFHVIPLGRDYVFATNGGGLYLAEWHPNGTRTVRRDWREPQLVVALLQDCDSGCMWAFGRNTYFEITKQLRPKQCPDILAEGSVGIGEPMRTVFQCARILHESGELSEAVETHEPSVGGPGINGE